jgi:hypothetical protein
MHSWTAALEDGAPLYMGLVDAAVLTGAAAQHRLSRYRWNQRSPRGCDLVFGPRHLGSALARSGYLPRPGGGTPLMAAVDNVVAGCVHQEISPLLSGATDSHLKGHGLC